MVDRAEFDRAYSSARTAPERVAIFGALLARTSRLGKRLVIVGGSAISFYTAGAYVSDDVDVVAPRMRVEPTLSKWGFVREGGKDRGYWVRSDLGLLVDIIDRPDYVGLQEGVRTESTRFGPVRIAAIEDLIVRRLVFSKREARVDLLDQAVLLWERYGRLLDKEYLAYLTRYEDVEDLFRIMRSRGRYGPAPKRARRNP